MTKPPKRLLCSRPKFIILSSAAILFLLTYLFLPLFFLTHHYLKLRIIFLFYTVNAAIIIFFVRRFFYKGHALDYQVQELEEKLNILQDSNLQEENNARALQAKIIRYRRLKNVIEEINQSLDLDSTAESLASISFSLVANNQGACILYLIDPSSLNPSVFKSKKEEKDLVIKAKQGDIFDYWVLRHANYLLVEDIKKDFRFDPEKLNRQDSRNVASLISAPFISEQRFLGILRLDSARTGAFSQEDLRLLATISDLGAVALENSLLYQKAQDLAIHDDLTMLYTKSFFLERLKEECKRCLRQKSSLSAMMLDIDYFKSYNDKFGHTAGDIVLRNLAGLIRESLKELNPVISRFGGEEFCIILPGIEKERALEIALSLLKKIEKLRIVLRRQETSVTVSIGVASFPGDAAYEDEIIRKADRAMYEAKQKGRNRVCSI